MKNIFLCFFILIFNCKINPPCSVLDSTCNPLGYFIPNLIRSNQVASTPTGTGTGTGTATGTATGTGIGTATGTGTPASTITFAGVSNLRILSSTSVELRWTAATSTAAGNMEYNIYRSATSGTQVFTTPVLTVNNVTTATITGITANTNNYYVVRARDTTGTTDTNTAERGALFNGLIRYIPLDATPLATGERIGNQSISQIGGLTPIATDRFGVANNAYLLNGSSQFFQFNQTTPTALPTGNNPKTFCAWIRTSSTSLQTITGYGNAPQANFMIVPIDGFISLTYDQSGGFNNQSTATSSITNGNWNFVCVTMQRTANANVSTFQINSNFISEYVNATTALNSDNSLLGTIGRFSSAASNWFNGNIAEVSIWNRVLTQAELLAVFRN